MFLFGASTFIGVLAPARLAVRLQLMLHGAVIAGALFLGMTGLAWLSLESGFIGDGWTDTVNPGAIIDVLTGSNFGPVWIVHLSLVAAAVLSLFSKGRLGAQLGAIAAGLTLASLALVGHAAGQDDVIGLVHRLNHALHLVSLGFWVGCLVPLLLCLRLLLQAEYRSDAERALRRFSSLGHVAVALVIATGAINTWLVLGALPTDMSAPYQVLLVAKICLVLLMVGIAIFNRYVAVPRLAAGRQTLRWITIGTGAEILIGVLVIALVSAFATFDPMPGMDM